MDNNLFNNDQDNQQQDNQQQDNNQNNNYTNLQNNQQQQSQWSYNSYGPIPPTQHSVKVKKNNGLKFFAVTISILFVLSLLGLSVFLVNYFNTNTPDNMEAQDGNANIVNSTPNIQINETPIDDTPAVDETGRMSGPAVYEKVNPAVVGVVTYAKAVGYQLYGQGSGVVISSDGYVITNAHVISAETGVEIAKIDVVLSNGEVFDAKIIGKDTKTDIAVLKIDAQNLVQAEFGSSSQLQTGETVYVIGNPDGLKFANSISDGIISSLNREIETQTTGVAQKYIQTTAVINRGNSGGALINQYGQIVGIPVAKIIKEGVEGIGFAIPIDDAKPIIESIIANGYVAGRVKIGLSYTSMSKTMSELMGIPYGIRVVIVDPASDAYAKGLEEGDIITHLDGQEVYDTNTVAKALSNKKPGDTISITIFRVVEQNTPKTLTIDVTLAEDKPAK
ncbi:MAG: S1C family serine protease [Oscillospiraceae bacterium]